MRLIVERIEALLIARAATAAAGSTVGDLVAPLARFAPAELTPAAWREQLIEIAGALRQRGELDDQHRATEANAVARRIGRSHAKTWVQLADRVLPALGLGVDAGDVKAHGRLAGRDAWAAAIVGRMLGLWLEGLPPTLAQLCDALAWRELALPGKPKRCPSEVRAVFVQRQLNSEAGPPERLVRLLAAREVGAPRPELRALRDALVRRWLADRALGAPLQGDGERDVPGLAERGERDVRDPIERGDHDVRGPAERGEDAVRGAADDGMHDVRGPVQHGEQGPGAPLQADDAANGFARDVARAAAAVRDGRFGDRKVFVSAVWRELREQLRWADLALESFKARLFAAHTAGELSLARADLVAAMDPELVAASEIAVDGASFHFVVQEPST